MQHVSVGHKDSVHVQLNKHHRKVHSLVVNAAVYLLTS